MKLAQDAPHDGETLGWDDLVAQKRKLSTDLKSLTDRLIDIDKNQMHKVSGEIRGQRAALDKQSETLRHVREEVDKNNAHLLSVSEKLSQSKNFLSIMESRLPSEDEAALEQLTAACNAQIDAGQYKTEREKNEILSRSKEASMKLEAIKATRTIKEQYGKLVQESSQTTELLGRLSAEGEAARARMAEINSSLDVLFAQKRKLASERDAALSEYDRIIREFDAVNSRLDSMAQMRKKQREEYGRGLPSDALFKVKETARKKLESGGKLSFEELKLLYEEKD